MGRPWTRAKEVRRAEVLSRVKRGELKLAQAAELLELICRQAKRLEKRYGKGRPRALVHGNAASDTIVNGPSSNAGERVDLTYE